MNVSHVSIAMWMEEALHFMGFMADHLTVRRPAGDGSSLPPTRARRVRLGLVMALPLLALCAAIWLPATASAHPGIPLGGGCSIAPSQQSPGVCANASPGYGSTGTQVTVQGSTYTPGHVLIITYAPT